MPLITPSWSPKPPLLVVLSMDPDTLAMLTVRRSARKRPDVGPDYREPDIISTSGDDYGDNDASNDDSSGSSGSSGSGGSFGEAFDDGDSEKGEAQYDQRHNDIVHDIGESDAWDDKDGTVTERESAKDTSTTRFARLRKRRRIIAEKEDDEEDEEDRQRLFVQTHEHPNLQSTTQANPLQHKAFPAPRKFMVKMVFYTLADERILVIVDRDVLLQSTLYSKLLSHVEFGGYQMPCIRDPNANSETTIMHAIEFLTQNTFPSLSLCQGSPSLSRQLEDKIDLYDFSVVAGIPALEDAVVQQLDCCPDLGLELFVSFASSCYEPGHQITRKSSMGRLLRFRLKRFLPAIMRSKEVSCSIQQKGGDLAAELEDVLQEHWAEMEDQAAAGISP